VAWSDGGPCRDLSGQHTGREQVEDARQLFVHAPSEAGEAHAASALDAFEPLFFDIGPRPRLPLRAQFGRLSEAFFSEIEAEFL
jgi:hypothetical protein